MNNEEMVFLLLKLVSGFAAAVTAVLLWSKTREVPWLFVVIGTIFLYGEVIFSALEFVGLANFYLFTLYGISLIRLMFSFLPFFFFAIGFTLFLVGRRKRF